MNWICCVCLLCFFSIIFFYVFVTVRFFSTRFILYFPASTRLMISLYLLQILLLPSNRIFGYYFLFINFLSGTSYSPLTSTLRQFSIATEITYLRGIQMLTSSKPPPSFDKLGCYCFCFPSLFWCKLCCHLDGIAISGVRIYQICLNKHKVNVLRLRIMWNKCYSDFSNKTY